MKMAQKKADKKSEIALVEEEIRTIAGTIYTERKAKGLAGDELSDWLKAEAMIKAKHKL
jgi:hypothetical protein